MSHEAKAFRLMKKLSSSLQTQMFNLLFGIPAGQGTFPHARQVWLRQIGLQKFIGGLSGTIFPRWNTTRSRRLSLWGRFDRGGVQSHGGCLRGQGRERQ